jgi:hypothetical protein
MKNIFTGVFYTTGLMCDKYLDRWLYKGKGRPRKEDYSTVDVLQKKLNKEMNNRIDRQMLEILPTLKSSDNRGNK